MGSCQDAILKEEKQGEKVKVCQITHNATENQWQRVLQSGEYKFEIFGSDISR